MSYISLHITIIFRIACLHLMKIFRVKIKDQIVAASSISTGVRRC